MMWSYAAIYDVPLESQVTCVNVSVSHPRSETVKSFYMH